MRRRAAWLLGALLVLMAGGGCPHTAATAATSAQTITVEGLVINPVRQPLPDAVVEIGGAAVRTDGTGRYQLQTGRASHAVARVWCPGYEDLHLALRFPVPPGSAPLPRYLLTPFVLNPSFVNPAAGAVLAGLPVRIKMATRVIHLHGVARLPLESRVAVTVPDGRVEYAALHRRGRSFTAAVPVRHRGAYRVEINGSNGFAVFNVLVFRGVAPFLPPDPGLAPEPAAADGGQRRQFILDQLNQVRTGMGLPPVAMRTQVLKAAVRHNTEMYRQGYYATHPHLGVDGSTVWQRVHQMDGRVRAVGETVGEGPALTTILLSLLDSPGHRAIILGRYRWAGVAVHRITGGFLLTVDFAR